MIAIQQIDRWIPLIALCPMASHGQSNEPVIIVPCDLGLFLYSFALDFIIILNNNLPAQPQTWAIIRWAMVVMWWPAEEEERDETRRVLWSRRSGQTEDCLWICETIYLTKRILLLLVFCVSTLGTNSHPVLGVTLSWVSLSKPQPHHITISGNG